MTDVHIGNIGVLANIVVTRTAMPAAVTVHTIVFNVHLAPTILFLYW